MRNWPGVEPLPSCRTLACLIEPLDLLLILLGHHLPFDFQRRRQFATLWGKIGRRNDKLLNRFIRCQLLIEVRHTCLEQLLHLRVRRELLRRLPGMPCARA